MTIEGLAFENNVPCSSCGASGDQVWLQVNSQLCYPCRNPKDNMLAKTTAPIEGTLEEPRKAAQGHLSFFDEMIDIAGTFSIDDQESAEMAATALNTVKARAKELEAEEKAATGPINEGLNRIRSWFAPARKRASAAEALWKGLILQSNREREAKARDALQAMQAAVAVNDLPRALVAQAQILPPEPVKGIQLRKRWTFKVTDARALPTEYLVPNEPAIRAVMAAMVASGQVPVLPGVVFEQIETLAAVG